MKTKILNTKSWIWFKSEKLMCEQHSLVTMRAWVAVGGDNLDGANSFAYFFIADQNLPPPPTKIIIIIILK